MAKRKLWVARNRNMTWARIFFLEEPTVNSVGLWFAENDGMSISPEEARTFVGQVPAPGECDEYEVTIRKVKTWVRT